jgi:hypothetical protein
MRFEMKFRLVTTALAAAMGAGLMAYADPPHSTRGDQPPGLAKQGKIRPAMPGKCRRRANICSWTIVPATISRTGAAMTWNRPLRAIAGSWSTRDAYLMEVTTGLVANAIIDLLD